jgi:hypothetical protein
MRPDQAVEGDWANETTLTGPRLLRDRRRQRQRIRGEGSAPWRGAQNRDTREDHRMTSAPAATTFRPYSPGNPPPPLVGRPGDHPLLWARNTTLLALLGAIITYLCVLIVVALYYDVFETIPTVTRWWHHTIPDPTLRHAVRDVGEGLIGGLGGVFAVRNRYKPLKPRNLLDTIEIDYLHIPNVKDDRRSSLWWLLGLPVLVLIYAQIGFWIAFGVIQAAQGLFHHAQVLASPRVDAHPSLSAQLTAVIAQQWPQKLMGYAAAFFFGRRPAKAVFDDLQLWQCEGQVLRGRTAPPWYYPPTWRATFHDVLTTGASAAERHGRAPSWALRTAALACGALVVQGGFIMLVLVKSS